MQSLQNPNGPYYLYIISIYIIFILIGYFLSTASSHFLISEAGCIQWNTIMLTLGINSIQVMNKMYLAATVRVPQRMLMAKPGSNSPL